MTRPDQMRMDSKALHSGKYVDEYEHKPISRIARLAALMKLGRHERLLDVACGNAMLLEVVHNKVASYDGVDFSEDFAEAARKRSVRFPDTPCSIHCEEIISFCSRRPEQFEVATALDFTEHVEDEELIPILRAVRSSLVPGGRLYLHTPNLDFVLERMRDAGVILRQRPEHVAVRTARENVQVLVAAGFERARVRAHLIPHYNILKILHPFSFVPLIGPWLKARVFIECTK